MKNNLTKDTLALMKISGLSGYEGRVRDYISAELNSFGFQPRTDRVGNLHLMIPGKGQRVMLFAHMDQLGLIVRKIEDNGYLRFERLGGIPEKSLPGQSVVVSTKDGKDHEGVIGIKSHHATSPEEKYSVLPYRDLYVDLGYSTKDEVRSLGVNIGSPIAYKPSADIIGKNRICGTSVDDRAGCAVLLEVARQIHNHTDGSEIHIVFTVQEEFNLRGALPAAQQINPDIALQIDLMLASDTPDMVGLGEVALGQGPGLSMYSFHGRGTLNGVIPHPTLVEFIEKTADSQGIYLQKSAHVGALTDLSYVQLVGEGVASADLGFPMRYSHSSRELCDVTDLVGLTQLLVTLLSTLPNPFPLQRRL